MENYGNKPAQDFSTKNFRIIIFKLNEEKIIENLKDKSLPEEYFQEWLLDLQNKICWETANLLADYFFYNPNADKVKTANFINSWNDNLPDDNLLRYKTTLLVNLQEINNDMSNYFDKNSLLIYPNQKDVGRKLVQQIGKENIKGVEDRNNFLILYWSIEYRGQMKKFSNPFSYPIYSTHYVGYNIHPSPLIDKKTDQSSYFLNEIRSWNKTE